MHGKASETTVTWQQLITTATKQLTGKSDTPRLDAEVLLRYLAGLGRERLIMVLPEEAPGDVIAPYRQVVSRRLAGEPVAYITGQREFMSLSFRVAAAVLIPRPETELLVEWALEILARRSGTTPARVVDVGTGSGAIAVSIAAHARAPIDVMATDMSPDAIAMATANADSLLSPERRSRVAFRSGSLLQPVDAPVDVVLANLPYLTPQQIAGNPELDSEPRLALDGGSDGLDLVRELVADLPRVLAPDGVAGIEIDPRQRPEVEAMLRTLFPGRLVRTIRDLAGHSRHVVLET